MREQWACPDLGIKKEEGYWLPIPGSTTAFDECPAYYLRMPGDELPAEHLIDGTQHPATQVGQWAFEIESGARLIDTVPAKGVELVHLYLNEKRSREKHEDEMRRGGRK